MNERKEERKRASRKREREKTCVREEEDREKERKKEAKKANRKERKQRKEEREREREIYLVKFGVTPELVAEGCFSREEASVTNAFPAATVLTVILSVLQIDSGFQVGKLWICARRKAAPVARNDRTVVELLLRIALRRIVEVLVLGRNVINASLCVALSSLHQIARAIAMLAPPKLSWRAAIAEERSLSITRHAARS
jgi:hypothetical protein